MPDRTSAAHHPAQPSLPTTARTARPGVIVGMLVAVMSLSACSIDTSVSHLVNSESTRAAAVIGQPATDADQADSNDSSPTTPEPTVAPEPTPDATAPPEPPVEPPPTPTSTPPSTPTPTPTPTVEPLAPTAPGADDAATAIGPGRVAVPIAGITTFDLPDARSAIQYRGHTLVFPDASDESEVDIFTPLFGGDATALVGFDAVVTELATNPIYADLVELEPTVVAGRPTRVFEGRPMTRTRGFFTEASTVDDDQAGWWPPYELRLWLIDAPRGAVAVTAESLVEDGPFDRAIELAEQVLATIELSPV